ncbi:MAG: TetR/AcrR family transcriptional regulator [Candidatus Thiodiazotropha sp. (ex. Lucinisca nassula)]|nr:TetR/AcrR family transcriptional regulator [Candidatus Thiodiazotropha sp. (ex. Lucinisca nassula)]MBW9262933.1 TetR/AcrR family transcriptional regulator [Candidatus Thiodiazotropha sp. (ex. Lucinisca nassula)]MBW9268751.1 TetR/AcrR family transcriptional regulator [Candidatus Thiodiazotropha sp. (ex. Lucinisca nassula)]
MTKDQKRAVKQPTRLGIIDAARSHIYHKGFGATSYANIAQQTKLQKGNIQYHFKSKDELLQAVIEQQVEGIREQLESWSLDCGTTYDCVERFITMVDDNADNLARYGCPMGTLNSELGKDHRTQQHQARAMFELYLRWLEARFSAILPRESARARAEQLMVMAQGASLMAHIHEDPEIVRRQSIVMREWLTEVCTNT